MKKIRFNILGCGKMATSMLIPISKSFNEIDIFTYTPTGESAQKLALQLEGNYCKDLAEMSEGDYYLIACKPQQFAKLSKDLSSIINTDGVVISVMAGINTATIMSSLNVKKVIRVMPNTPTSIELGVHGLFSTKETGNKEKETVISWLEATGKVFSFAEENKIDLITPFSGSGPGVIFELARILIEKMKKDGIDEDLATEMVKETFLGASQLLLKSKLGPEELRNNVTSKGGVTFEILETFKREGLEEIIAKAIDQGHQRSQELSKLS